MSQFPRPEDDLSPYTPPLHGDGAPLESVPEGDATGGVIPYKNVPALLAYYFGIFALIPCVGLFLGIPALVLGVLGLLKRRQNPAVRGSVHAWVGIVLGGLCTLIWGGMIALVILGAVANR